MKLPPTSAKIPSSTPGHGFFFFGLLFLLIFLPMIKSKHEIISERILAGNFQSCFPIDNMLNRHLVVWLSGL